MSSHPNPLFPHSRLLLCRPAFYNVEYQINPWMDVHKTPDKILAAEEWNTLHHTLLRLGAWVEYADQPQGLPDMVFTANAGLINDKTVVLSRFRYLERQGEEPLFKAAFERLGFRVVLITDGCFEGEGDALFCGDTLIGGTGFRSDAKAYDEIKTLLNLKNVKTVELVDPRFYHLDTCYCPVSKDLAFAYPGAFTTQGFKTLESVSEVIKVSEHEAQKFVCNSVVLGKEIVMPQGGNQIVSELTRRGYTVHQLEMSQFMKAGGASKCLCIELDRKV